MVQQRLVKIRLCRLMLLIILPVSCIHGFHAMTAVPHRRPHAITTKTTTILIQASSSSFNDLGLSPEALDAIQGHQWQTPTPIQQLAIPQLLVEDEQEEARRSALWCEAPTGSGKTSAFVLPLLQNIMQNKQQQSKSQASTITSLILCPTRELAHQIGSVVREVAAYMTMPSNIAVITGGDRRDEQLAQLAEWAQCKEAVDVVVATPGRLVDVLTHYNQQDLLLEDPYNEWEQEQEGSGRRQSASDAALERRLLQAMDAHGKHVEGGRRKHRRGPRRSSSSSSSLSLEQIQALQLDRDDDEGRSQLGDLLDGLQYLVLDEADKLLGRAFAKDMDAVLDLLKPRQEHEQPVVHTWLFSATFPRLMEPRIESVLQQLGHASTVRIACANSDRRLESDVDEDVSATLQKRLDRVHHQKQVSNNNNNNPRVEQIGPASTIDLRTIRLEKRDRTQALKFLLKENQEEWMGGGGVLVFVATRYAAEHVSRKLRRAGIRSHELHGKLDQHARMRRLGDFQRCKTQVLIATDLASRGLDVEGLACVVNYDLPRSTADFVHRVGRTGRAGKQGSAITFLTASTEGHYDLIEKRHLSQATTREILPGFQVDEEKWQMEAEGSRRIVPGATPSEKGLAYDRMFGGIKGHRKSKKDRLREKAAREAAAAAE